MRKRALSLLLAMALVLGLSVGASAASAAPTDLNRYLLSHTSRSGETRSLPIDRTARPPAAPSSSMWASTPPSAPTSPS